MDDAEVAQRLSIRLHLHLRFLTKQFLYAIVNSVRIAQFLPFHSFLIVESRYLEEVCFRLAGGLIKLDLPIRVEKSPRC